jgi:hypothetical protein
MHGIAHTYTHGHTQALWILLINFQFSWCTIMMQIGNTVASWAKCIQDLSAYFCFSFVNFCESIIASKDKVKNITTATKYIGKKC